MAIALARHLWVAHLCFIAIAASLVGRAFNEVAESTVLSLPLERASTEASRAPERTGIGLNTDRFAQLLGLSLSSPDPVPPEFSGALERTRLPLKLLGTLLARRNPEWSMASLQDTSTLGVHTFMPGDRVLGAQVLEVERARVILLNGNRREYLDGASASPAGEAASPKPAANLTPTSAALGRSVKRVAENIYVLPRSEVDRTLANLADLANQAYIMPAFRNGVALGFRLTSIRPDSLYSNLGVENGDVIRRINGYELNSPERALEVYGKLRESSRIDLEIERQGASLLKTYTIR